MPEAGSKPLASPPEDQESWQRLSRSYRLAGLLLSAHRLGLLRRLHERGTAHVGDLSTDLIADQELLDLMCRTLYAAGVLEEAGEGCWRLTPPWASLVSHPAAILELDALAADYQRWGQLDAGARRLAVDAPPEPDPYDDASRLGSDTGAARRYAQRVSARRRDQFARLLDPLEPTRPIRVLDVGGGDGELVREITRRWPDARCTLLELPAMAEIAEQACAGEDRIQVVGGRFFSESTTQPGEAEPLPDAADVVIISHVLSTLSEAEQRKLALRTAKVLEPGGCLVSCESVLLYDAKGPLDILLWTIAQAAARQFGHVLTTLEQDTLLRAAGLAAAGEWWVTADTRAVLGVHLAAGVDPALHITRDSRYR